MTECEWAWLAGFFDGEGSVLFNLRNRPGKGREDYVSLQISQKPNEPLDEIAAMVGAGKVRRWKGNGNGIHTWRLSGRHYVEQVILGMLPYSRVKRAELELALVFIKELTAGCTGRGRRLDPAMVQRREELKILLTKMWGMKKPLVVS